MENKNLTYEEIENYKLLLEQKQNFEERRELLLSILDNTLSITDDNILTALHNMLKLFKEDLKKIRADFKENFEN